MKLIIGLFVLLIILSNKKNFIKDSVGLLNSIYDNKSGVYNEFGIMGLDIYLFEKDYVEQRFMLPYFDYVSIKNAEEKMTIEVPLKTNEIILATFPINSSMQSIYAKKDNRIIATKESTGQRIF